MCDAHITAHFKSPPDKVEGEWPALMKNSAKMMIEHLKQEHGYEDNDLWFMGSPPMELVNEPSSDQ